MPSSIAEHLRSIRAFPQLVKYLRDEMGWPIESEDFEELTFDYTAEELGIDPKTAAKVEEIKRLRPLTTHQPWGIFFVKFAPGRLPVVALRRILGQLVVRKRASANRADRAAWEADDLLFISNYGEGGERQIAFAHFSQNEQKSDLPTLKVLGWDNRDTALHLDDVADKLTHDLKWPTDDGNAKAWRSQWRAAFTLRHRQVVTTSKELSIRLAELARDICDRIKTALAIETERGSLTKLMKAFQTSLVHDLDADGFADMYAQTIAYGLLSARIADPARKTADDLAVHMRTNPFLRELMATFLKVGGRRGRAGGPGIDFDELGVNDVVQLLDDANMEAVVRDFGDKNPQEDPVIHFYELFLKEYDAKKRMQRGVFYTPRPVVSYIVRSVDELLRTEFGLEDGLADTTTWGEMAKRHKDFETPRGTSPDQAYVQILDPATGTGTFLVEVIDIIHKTMATKWAAQGNGEQKVALLWNEYVPKHLLPRLHAYELLMAPYAIAHLKVGLKLYETGYRFGSNERARIYLTNALEPAHDLSGSFEFALPALAHEAQAVNEIKKHCRFTVVVGNPPYSHLSSNLSKQMMEIVEPYKSINGVRLVEKGALSFQKNLQDDYVKFIRLAEVLIATASRGIVGYITNHSFLTNPTFRGLRFSLLTSFRRSHFVDLHGNSLYGEATLEHKDDENVFDIKQGVSISLLRAHPLDVDRSVRRVDYWGPRASKYGALAIRNVLLDEGVVLEPAPDFWVFREEDATVRGEYSQFSRISELFPLNSTGVKTHRDHFAVAFERTDLEQRIADFRDLTINDKDVAKRYDLADTGAWKLREKRKLLAADKHWRDCLLRTTHRLFDSKWIFYSSDVVELPRFETMRHLLASSVRNVALCFPRNLREPWQSHAFVSREVVHKDALSSLDTCYAAPMYVVNADDGILAGVIAPNLSAKALAAISQVCPSVDAEACAQFLGYCYAILFSRSFGERYAEFLRNDYPRIPLIRNQELFRAMAQLGDQLVALHLLEAPKLDQVNTSYAGSKNPLVERVSWSDDTVWLNADATKKGQSAKPGTSGFHGVPDTVWNFHIGGYQVCEKWLKDRKGRTLSKDEISRYQMIVDALSETIRLMREIDEVIELHGGWPGAFQTQSSESASSTMQSQVALFRPRLFKPLPKERYKNCVPVVPIKAAAGAFGNPQHFQDNEFEWATIETRHKLRQGMFLAQVSGKSMEPAIPDGAWCLFSAPVTGTRQGKTVLVQMRDASDPETGESYTVKRYHSEKAGQGDLWQHTRIVLLPINKEFKPIELNAADADRLQVVAELVEVLG